MHDYFNISFADEVDMNTTGQGELAEIIEIRRDAMLVDMMTIFDDETIIERNVNFKYHNEIARDNNGVSRDVYSEFWHAFFGRYADGEDERVPLTTDEGGEAMWLAFGRVLLKGYKDHAFFPICLNFAFFAATVFTEDMVSSDAAGIPKSHHGAREGAGVQHY